MSANTQRNCSQPLVQNMDHTFKILMLFFRLLSLKEKIKQIPTFKLKCHKVFLTDLLPVITI